MPPEAEYCAVMSVEETDSPEQELRRIAGALEHSRRDELWQRAGVPDGEWGMAWVCRVQPARLLHVIGASALVERLRELLADGYLTSWELQPMPESRTLLHHYRDQLAAVGPQPGSLRGYNQLERAGFVYAEEVIACPDEALLAVRNLGSKALTAIRGVLGEAPARVHSAAPAGQAGQRHDHLRGQLTAAAAARYREFVQSLASSAIPTERWTPPASTACWNTTATPIQIRHRDRDWGRNKQAVRSLLRREYRRPRPRGGAGRDAQFPALSTARLCR